MRVPGRLIRTAEKTKLLETKKCCKSNMFYCYAGRGFEGGEGGGEVKTTLFGPEEHLQLEVVCTCSILFLFILFLFVPNVKTTEQNLKQSNLDFFH